MIIRRFLKSTRSRADASHDNREASATRSPETHNSRKNRRVSWGRPAVARTGRARRHPPPELQQRAQKNLWPDASRVTTGFCTVALAVLHLQEITRSARRDYFRPFLMAPLNFIIWSRSWAVSQYRRSSPASASLKQRLTSYSATPANSPSFFWVGRSSRAGVPVLSFVV